MPKNNDVIEITKNGVVIATIKIEKESSEQNNISITIKRGNDAAWRAIGYALDTFNKEK